MLSYNNLDVKLVKYAETRKQAENNTTTHLTPMFYYHYFDQRCLTSRISQSKTVYTTLCSHADSGKVEQTSKVTGVATPCTVLLIINLCLSVAYILINQFTEAPHHCTPVK